MYQQTTYPVDEDTPTGTVEACVAIVSATATMLSSTSTVVITFADGSAPSASMSNCERL